MSDKLDQNRPPNEYSRNPWGNAAVDQVETARDWHDGRVTVSVMQYDPRTGERVGDTKEVWDMRELSREKDELEKRLAEVDHKLSLIAPLIESKQEEELAIEAEAERQRVEREAAQAAAIAAADAAALAAANAAAAVQASKAMPEVVVPQSETQG